MKQILFILFAMLIIASMAYADEPVKIRGDLTAFVESFGKKVEQVGDYGSNESIDTIRKFVRKNSIELLTPNGWLGNVPPSQQLATLHSMLTSLPPDTVIFVARSPECIADELGDEKLKIPENVTPTYIKSIPVDLVEGVKYSYEDQPYRRLISISKEPLKKVLSSKKKVTWKVLGVKSPVFSGEELSVNYRNSDVACGLWQFNDKKTMGEVVVNLGTIDRDTEDLGVFGGMVRDSENFSTNDGITAVIRHGTETDGATNLIKQSGFQISARIYAYTIANPSASVRKLIQLLTSK